MKLKCLGVFLLMLVCVPVYAANVLYYADAYIGTNFVSPALTAGGHTVTTASSWSDFDTRLAGGGFDMAVAIIQNATTGPSATTLTSFLSSGGRAVLIDWRRDATLGALFGATYTGSNNQSPATLTSGTLSAGITNPVAIVNPGWGTWSMGMTPTASGASLGSFPNGNSCVISSHSGKALVIGFLADTLPSADGQRFFQNEFGFALNPPGAGIPTLTEWGIILQFVLIGLAGFYLIRRRRRHSHNEAF
jgi:hypothetical protein